MTVSVRPLLVPGIVLATAGAVALSPALGVAPAAPAPVSVHIEDIQLAGIGQDIYNSVTPYVQYAVGGVSYLVNFLPLVGAPAAAQININYFQGIQPVVAATVNYLAGVVQNPLNFIATTAAYGTALYDIAYNWVSAQAVWIGLPPLPPLPPAAAVARRPASARAVAAATAPRDLSRVGRAARKASAAPRIATEQSRKAAKPARAVGRAAVAAK
ncbi:MAG: hypothetical protein ACR2JI_04625 [Mycobacterium sp.]